MDDSSRRAGHHRNEPLASSKSTAGSSRTIGCRYASGDDGSDASDVFDSRVGLAAHSLAQSNRARAWRIVSLCGDDCASSLATATAFDISRLFRWEGIINEPMGNPVRAIAAPQGG